MNQLISTLTSARSPDGERSIPGEAVADRLRGGGGGGGEAALRDALLAICEGDWDAADAALARSPGVDRADAACLNLRGVVCEARG